MDKTTKPLKHWRRFAYVASVTQTDAIACVPRLDLLHGGFTRDIQRIVLTVTGPSAQVATEVLP
ncbi:uncharacterized protein PHALS_03163 [Plasmopara halstedii]|uniref:Uncharacterized protein n=1 Tax=Plasmopara halstedii TaxID=4781 RepID=A0A0N7L3R6_PLAHL|nr:uncharacterized protein PHALS_03163 [Plasmopara halstedii]CEG36619.1 hypothetical protein PHALS_03163 [Plasmopara halstedii]|eukprot:XP_024572988.1 hypothetical protein PHALS_03163 [Plasmopara halstedii]